MDDQRLRPPVRRGRVWADNDKRSHGRRLMVLEVDDTHARVVWADTRRHTRIRLSRFRPNSTGYRLIHDYPALSATEGMGSCEQ